MTDDPLQKHAVTIRLAEYEAECGLPLSDEYATILDLSRALAEHMRYYHTVVACRKCHRGVRPAYSHDGLCDECADEELAELRKYRDDHLG